MTDETPAAKCDRCGNYLHICGHDLTFAEKMKSVRINYGSLPTKGRSRD